MGVLQHTQGFQALCIQILSDRKSKHTIVTAISHISYTASQASLCMGHIDFEYLLARIIGVKDEV